MFCWQARRRFDTDDAGVERHLLSCGRCRVELDWLRRLPGLVREAGAVRLPESVRFEQIVLREARARLAAPSRLSPRRMPLPLAAAVSLMVAAVAAAHLLIGVSPSPAPRQAEADRDIPFVVQEDLVGERRGRIPLTTYVLEPAPDEAPVLRTSL